MKRLIMKLASDKKVFLGGTVNETTWRDELISLLKIDYFNPVVDKNIFIYNWINILY